MTYDHKNRLVLETDIDAVYYSLLILPLLTFVCLFLFIQISVYEYLIGPFFVNFVKSILVLVAIMFIIAVIFAVYLIASKQLKAAELNHEGIWVRFYGFIPWEAVVDFDTWKTPGAPLESISIKVKDRNRLYKQASLSGKLSLFWAKIFNYPHILIAATNVSNVEILSFARNYINS